ncbi:MAG: metallophosphatase family protein [Nitrososphaerales archaeon]|nr:metallophosphatase family protein [Nitrososphaerales archaeon]
MAFISDVHSNLEALEAVLGQLGKEELFCLGDIVGYGSNPNEVIQLLKDRRAVAVRGNHDEAVLTGDTSWFNARAAMAAKWTTGQLSEESRAYLRGLPLQIRTAVEEVQTYLTHGSPDDNLHEYVDPATHSELLGHYLARLDVRLLGLGHTHLPYVWKEDSGTVFNPGSVGQPRDNDWRASFAYVTFAEGKAEVQLLRTEYDCRKAAGKMLKAGLPESLAMRLLPRT